MYRDGVISFFVVITFCFFINLLPALAICFHGVLSEEQVLYSASIEPARMIKKRSISQSLRIHLVYDSTIHSLSRHKQHLVVKNLIPTAVKYWQDTLQVRRTNKPIRLSRHCTSDRVRFRDGDLQPYCNDNCSNVTMCGDVVVPESHLDKCHMAGTAGTEFVAVGDIGEGVENADFILYVSAKSTDRCFIGSTVAYAAYCQLEPALDRPVAGYVNLCPESLSNKPHDVQQMHSTIKHEILHALGFSVGLFAFYRDANGEPMTTRLKSTGRPRYNHTTRLYQWNTTVVKSFVRKDWKVRSGVIDRPVNMIVTPRVVAEVRKHFNCSTIEGAELEDQGVNGTLLTHWEKRIFENEMMTGTYTQNPVISRITLALMEDTGWYRVKYENADDYLWGRNLGCEFVTKSCKEWIDSKEQRGSHVQPYCKRIKKSSNLRTECTEGGDAVALCNLVEYTEPLSAQYQYFSHLPGVNSSDLDRYAGSVALADYCPYLQEFSWKKEDKIVRGSQCRNEHNNADPEINYSLEKYGSSSLCFEHGSRWTVQHCSTAHPVEHWGSGCYEYNCSNATGLSIVFNGVALRCVHAGQLLNVSVTTTDWLHRGTVVCPQCSEVCQNSGVSCPAEEDKLRRVRHRYDSIAPCSAVALVTLNCYVLSTWMTVFIALHNAMTIGVAQLVG